MVRPAVVERTAVRAFGRRARVESSDPAVRELLGSLFPAPVYVGEEPTGFAPERTWVASTAEDAARRVAPAIEIWFAEWADERVFVHSGCVEWGGRALMLPGRSMSGKTTLTLALLSAGARYMSDEFALLDRAGRVHAYPREPRVRAASRWRTVEVGDVRTSSGPGPVPVGLVARLAYSQSQEASFQEVTPARGVLELMDNTVCARSRPRDAMESTSAAVADARVLVGTRGDADEAAAALLAAMAGS